MAITTVGIDLAKNVFAVHGVDQNGRAVLVRPKVSRAALPELIASLPHCVIGMEACSGASLFVSVSPRIFGLILNVRGGGRCGCFPGLLCSDPQMPPVPYRTHCS